MYINVTKSVFMYQFRTIRPDNFTYDGLAALYDYLDELDELDDCEFDVIGICCEFSQYDSLDDALEAYSLKTIEELEDRTNVIYCNDESVIVQEF